MEIPYTQLSDDALTNLITDFVCTTDDSSFDTPLIDKIEQVKYLLSRGRCIVTFDEETGSCNILKT